METALAATVRDKAELTSESADLLYHLLVLLGMPIWIWPLLLKNCVPVTVNPKAGKSFLSAVFVAVTFYNRQDIGNKCRDYE